MITFATIDTRFRLNNKREIKKWIGTVIASEGKRMGDIAYIFCSDEYLGSMNMQYLKHDTFTDIITFDYTEAGVVSGDIFISIDRVRDNAAKFNVSFLSELGRVMAHGILHLVGYKDKTSQEKEEMRGKEDLCLKTYPISK